MMIDIMTWKMCFHFNFAIMFPDCYAIILADVMYYFNNTVHARVRVRTQGRDGRVQALWKLWEPHGAPVSIFGIFRTHVSRITELQFFLHSIPWQWQRRRQKAFVPRRLRTRLSR